MKIRVRISTHSSGQLSYIAHLLGVASLVMGENGYVPFPVTENMVIGALLHDVVEDEGGLPRLRDIEANFGKIVARIVEGCTDSFEEDSSRKQEWEVRKTLYIDRLRTEPQETLLVSAADKVYNARAILEDYREIGQAVWSRFKRGRKEQLWYFTELSKVYEERGSNRLTKELQRVIGEFTQLSAGES